VVVDSQARDMITPLLRQSLEKQGYRLIGTHSGVKLCRWTKVLFISLLCSCVPYCASCPKSICPPVLHELRAGDPKSMKHRHNIVG